jgi:hypothetical protein
VVLVQLDKPKSGVSMKKKTKKKSTKIINETVLVELVKTQGFDFLHQVVDALTEFEGDSISFAFNLIKSEQKDTYYHLDIPSEYCRLSQLSSEIDRFNARFVTLCRIKDVAINTIAEDDYLAIEFAVSLEKPSGTEVRLNIN